MSFREGLGEFSTSKRKRATESQPPERPTIKRDRLETDRENEKGAFVIKLIVRENW
jgi:hypothetical protein